MALFVFAQFLQRISSADPRVHFGVLWGCVDEDGSGGLHSRGAKGAGPVRTRVAMAVNLAEHQGLWGATLVMKAGL